MICEGSQLLRVTNQLKLEALDGKLRFTDVMDAHGVLRLIQICPSPKAEAFRLWIAGLAAGEDSRYYVSYRIKSDMALLR